MPNTATGRGWSGSTTAVCAVNAAAATGHDTS